MAENTTAAAAASRPDDPATRARDQLGALFFALSIALACGGVAAGRDPHGSLFKHEIWWWIGWSLLMYTPAVIFTLGPWVMRTVLERTPRGAVQDATLAFYGMMGFAAVLGGLDALILACFSEVPPRALEAKVLVFVLPPLVATPAAVLLFRGRQAWLPALLPLAIFLNALLVEWAAGFTGHSFIR